MEMETPSKEPDVLDPIQDVEDSVMANGSLKKANNLWTTEAREDLFSRRESGEGWETICPDYPNRSRHAMQQQYSVSFLDPTMLMLSLTRPKAMKREIAKANGTWVPDRRGRKRKQSGERWATGRKRRTTGFDYYEDGGREDEDATEDEEPDFASEYADENIINGGANGGAEPPAGARPALALRSATAPALRVPRSKIMVFPLQSNSRLSMVDGARTSSIDSRIEYPRQESDSSGYPHKRQRRSPDYAESPDATSPCAPAMVSGDETVIRVNKRELLELIRRSEENDRKVKLNEDAESASLRNSFETSVARALRRAHDAQEKLRNASLQYADTLKSKDREHAEELVVLKRELDNFRTSKDQRHAEEILVLKQDLERLERKCLLQAEDLKHSKEVQRSALDSLQISKENSERECRLLIQQQAQKVESLEDASDKLQKQQESNNEVHKAALISLQDELRRSREETEKAQMAIELRSELEDLHRQISSKNSQLQECDVRRRRTILALKDLRTWEGRAQDQALEINSAQQELRVSVQTLIDEWDDASPKLTAKRVRDLLQRLEEIDRKVQNEEHVMKDHMAVLERLEVDLTNPEVATVTNGIHEPGSHSDKMQTVAPLESTGNGDRGDKRQRSEGAAQSETNGGIDHSSPMDEGSSNSDSGEEKKRDV